MTARTEENAVTVKRFFKEKVVNLNLKKRYVGRRVVHGIHIARAFTLGGPSMGFYPHDVHDSGTPATVSWTGLGDNYLESAHARLP